MGQTQGFETVKPTLLVATTDRWFPTARLAIAMAKAGFSVEAVCPAGHPIETAGVAERMYGYNGLAPLRSVARAIAASRPNIIIPGDDRAARHLCELHRRDQSGRPSGSTCALIEHSIGDPKSFPLLFARAGFIELARAQGIRAPKTEVITSSGDLKSWAERYRFPDSLEGR